MYINHTPDSLRAHLLHPMISCIKDKMFKGFLISSVFCHWRPWPPAFKLPAVEPAAAATSLSALGPGGTMPGPFCYHFPLPGTPVAAAAAQNDVGPKCRISVFAAWPAPERSLSPDFAHGQGPTKSANYPNPLTNPTVGQRKVRQETF